MADENNSGGSASYFYGLTGMETAAEESTQAHAIVAEITQYGVTQRQILQIIKRLALNLNNADHMRQIARLADTFLDGDLSVSIEEAEPWIDKG